jgi:hypothetical protein
MSDKWNHSRKLQATSPINASLHHAATVKADIPYASVIAKDNDNVWFLLL